MISKDWRNVGNIPRPVVSAKPPNKGLVIGSDHRLASPRTVVHAMISPARSFGARISLPALSNTKWLNGPGSLNPTNWEDRVIPRFVIGPRCLWINMTSLFVLAHGVSSKKSSVNWAAGPRPAKICTAYSDGTRRANDSKQNITSKCVKAQEIATFRGKNQQIPESDILIDILVLHSGKSFSSTSADPLASA